MLPCVVPTCNGMLLALAIRMTRSRSARGAMEPSSNPRSTAPLPSGAYAKVGCSNGVSLDTKVSIAYTRRSPAPLRAAKARAPSNPPSSPVVQTRITLWLSVVGSIFRAANTSAVEPVRSSEERPVTRVPARRAARLRPSTAAPVFTPRAVSPAASSPNHARSRGGALLRAVSRGTKTPRSASFVLPLASGSKTSMAGCPSHAEGMTPPFRVSVTWPSGRMLSTSNETSSVCATKATESLSGPTATIRLPAESTTARSAAHLGSEARMAFRTRHSWPGTPGRSRSVVTSFSVAS